MKNGKFGLLCIGVLLVLTACTNQQESPKIQATNHPNQTGGQLQITGSGFTKGNPIAVGILNVPGASTWSQSAGNADGNGNINVTVSYSYASGADPLPGCQTGSNATANLNVTATDKSTHSFGTAQVGVPDCGWSTPQVSSHQ